MLIMCIISCPGGGTRAVNVVLCRYYRARNRTSPCPTSGKPHLPRFLGLDTRTKHHASLRQLEITWLQSRQRQ